MVTTKQVKILDKIEMLQNVDLSKLTQALPYAETLEFNDLMLALKEQNAKTLAAQGEELAAQYAAKLEQLVQQNEQLLADWEEKTKQTLSKLQASLEHVSAKLSELFDFDEHKTTFLTKQLMILLAAENLDDVSRAKEHNLRIRLANKDYMQLKQHLSAIDADSDGASYAWLIERLKIDNSLDVGVAIFEDDYVSAKISFALAKQKCVNMVTNLLTQQHNKD